jgi:hypothetical protein
MFCSISDLLGFILQVPHFFAQHFDLIPQRLHFFGVSPRLGRRRQSCPIIDF